MGDETARELDGVDFATMFDNRVTISPSELSTIPGFEKYSSQLLQAMSMNAAMYPRGTEILRRGFTKSAKNVTALKVLSGKIDIGFVNPETAEFEPLISIGPDNEGDTGNHFLLLSWLKLRSTYEMRASRAGDVSVIQFSKATIDEMIRQSIALGNRDFSIKMVERQVKIFLRMFLAAIELLSAKVSDKVGWDAEFHSIREVIYSLYGNLSGIAGYHTLDSEMIRMLKVLHADGMTRDVFVSQLDASTRKVVASKDKLNVRIDAIEQMVDVLLVCCGARPL